MILDISKKICKIQALRLRTMALQWIRLRFRVSGYPWWSMLMMAPMKVPMVRLSEGWELLEKWDERIKKYTLQGINISHLGKRKIIFKMPFLGDMLIPWRVVYRVHIQFFLVSVKCNQIPLPADCQGCSSRLRMIHVFLACLFAIHGIPRYCKRVWVLEMDMEIVFHQREGSTNFHKHIHISS